MSAFPAFRWTIARATEDAALARGEAPPGFLSPVEQSVLGRLTFFARRRKWVLGRWAAKRILREAIAETGWGARDDVEISVLNDGRGVPHAVVAGVGPVPWCVSLSHRGDVAFAALARAPGVAIGADLETVEPRDPAFVRAFFTDAEAEAVARANGRDGDRLVALVWSCKEAVLKAQGVGLREDARRVEVRTDATDEAPRGWRSAEASYARPPGSDACTDQASAPGRFRLAWRDEGDFVLTVAALARAPGICKGSGVPG